MTICAVKNSEFDYFVNSNHGGVVSISREIALEVKCVHFKKCVVPEPFFGGCIYYSSICNVVICGIYANECSSYGGFVSYVSGSSNKIIKIEMNDSITMNSYGSEYCVCANYYANLYVRGYNTSFCYSKTKYCNLHSWYGKTSSASFCNFYKNNISVLYGVDTYESQNRLSYSNFLNNKKLNNNYGIIHTNTGACTLYIDNIYAYNNDETLLSCYTGKIIVESLQCDVCTMTGNAIDTQNVNINAQILILNTNFEAGKCKHENYRVTKSVSNYKKMIQIANILILLIANSL